MIVIFTFLATLLIHSIQGNAVAGEFLSDGLPLEIPANYLVQRKFVDFGPDEPIGLTQRAPLGSHLIFDGKTISSSDRSQQRGVLEEHFLAALPGGQRIQIGKDVRGHEAWFYPTGTEVAHVVSFRGLTRAENGLLELRLIQKRAEGDWSFAIYTPVPGTSVLRLNREGDPSTPQKRLFTALDAQDIPIQVSLARIHTESCLGCHSALTPSRDQYDSLERVGPCGFVPANPLLRTDWASRYLRERGEVVFSGGERTRRF